MNEQTNRDDSSVVLVRRRALSWPLSLMVAVISAGSALAAPGDLDSTFDNDGKVTTDFGSGLEEGRSVAIQSDGKIVTAGFSFNGSNYDFVLARYNASDGSLDTSFDTDGKTTTAFTSTTDQANSVAIQANGKIVVAGFSNGFNRDLALARYNAAPPQCSDTIDNDSDGKTDFGTDGDPDCESADDDNETAAPTLSVDNVTVNEGNSGTTSATFAVTRSGNIGSASTVDFAAEDGTATTADNDYEENSGTLTFAQNETQKTITVEINGDTKDENDEAFFVNLSNPSNATISDNQGTGTITDDDAPDTTITSGPTGTINTDSATFEFSSTDSGSTFECKLAGAALSSCSSPKSCTGLAEGSHTFRVKAKDAAGNLDATPASRTFMLTPSRPG